MSDQWQYQLRLYLAERLLKPRTRLTGAGGIPGVNPHVLAGNAVLLDEVLDHQVGRTMALEQAGNGVRWSSPWRDFNERGWPGRLVQTPPQVRVRRIREIGHVAELKGFARCASDERHLARGDGAGRPSRPADGR